MIQISLCMIVKNEEDVLARCLESVRCCVDEIVLVDTGSTDETKSIARQYTDKIYDFKWINDFAAARNFSFSKASCDYILWLDADDIISETDRQKLLQLKQTLDPSVDMVMMRYHTAFDQNGNPVFSYFRERLMKRSAGYHWQGAVHEAIVPSGNVIHSSIAVTHHKLRTSDPDRNIKIFEQLLSSGKQLEPRQQFYYARELYSHGRLSEAITYFRLFLSNPAGWIENKITACLDLSHALEQAGDHTSSLRALFQSFQYDRPRAEICCEIGSRFLEQKHYQIAIFWFQTAADCPTAETAGAFTFPDCQDFIPYLQLCVCHDRLGDRQNALYFHQKAKRIHPQHPSVLFNDEYFLNTAL